MTERSHPLHAPMAFDVRLLGPADAAMLDHVAEGVFDRPVVPRWRDEFLADPRHHLVVARDDGCVVGFASAVHYVHPDKGPELWINEVGVAPSHQRRGIGRELVTLLLAHARALGCGEAWVLTEDDNMPARRLYQASGGVDAGEHAIMYAFPLADDGV
jgi:ribosomal protein S18 acetylase RimI-like enzyme